MGVFEDLLIVGRRLFSDGVELGFTRRISPIDFRVAELAAALAALGFRILLEVAGVNEELGLAVAVHVREGRRFTVRHVEDIMLSPFAAFSLRVDVEPGRGTREAIDEDVGPAVAIEVMGVGDEVVGVALGAVIRLRGGRGVGFFLFEVRSEPDGAAGRDIHVAIMIEVRDCDAFGDEVLSQGLLREADLGGGGARKERGQGEGEEGAHGMNAGEGGQGRRGGPRASVWGQD